MFYCPAMAPLPRMVIARLSCCRTSNGRRFGGHDIAQPYVDPS
jgi:hypothetical protein